MPASVVEQLERVVKEKLGFSGGRWGDVQRLPGDPDLSGHLR